MNSEIRQHFSDRFGQAPTTVARAPGRLEVLGNHTDYNEGLVISCAIDRATWFAASNVEGNNQCTIYDARADVEATFDITQLEDPQRGDWANYVKGIIQELHQAGHQVQPFNAVILSTIPMSSGMSSSAALEIAAAYAFGRLNDINLPPADWAKIGQACENNYVGANTGLLDQLTSIMGKTNALVYSDFRSLKVDHIPLPDDLVFVVANSGVTHDLTEDYNVRRERCVAAVDQLKAKVNPSITSLRDIDSEGLEAAKSHLDDLTYRRAKHVVGETDRVKLGIEALASGDREAFGQLLFESHMSSRYNFENSCPELDILVETARSLEGCYGARLSGGGFGGISIHLVQQSMSERYAQRLATAYEARLDVVPETMICSIGEGAEFDV